MSKFIKVEENTFFYKLFLPLTLKKAIIIISSLGLLVFFNMLLGGFVWDDKTFILNNSLFFKSGGLLKYFLRNPFNNLGYYRGIQALYFSILFNLFGTNQFFYHFFQLIIHISNCVLVYVFFKKFFNKSLSLLLSVIFLAHPIQVESVSYISGTGEPLFFLFGISSFILYRSNLQKKIKFVLIFVLLILSLLTKETGIMFPIVLVFYIYIFEEREQIVKYAAISIASVCTYIYLRFVLAGVFLFNINFLPISKLPITGRLYNIPLVFFYYLKTFFFPISLSIDQLWYVQKINVANFYLPLIADLFFLIFLFTFGIYLFKKNKKDLKTYIFFSFWYLFGILLYLQIFPLDQTVSDRWFYFPIIGVLGIFGLAIKNLIEVKIIKEKLVYIFLIFVIVLFSLRTMIRNSDWQNPIRLYTHDIRISDNYNLESNLASEFFANGNYNEAINHYKKSASMLPYDRIYNNIAYIYEITKDKKLAKEYYLKSLNSIDPIPPYNHKVDIYENVSRFLYYYDNANEAHKYILLGLKQYPENFTLWVLLGLSLRKLNNQSAAQTAFQKAYGLADTKNAKNIIKQIISNPNINVPINMFY